MDNRISISAGTDRVKTITAPPGEIDRWDEWAEELDMTRSLFIRCAVSAGISKIDPPTFATEYGEAEQSYQSEIKDAVRSGAQSPDEVVETVTEAVQDDIRDDLQELIDSGQVTTSAYGGLTLSEDKK